MDKLPMKIDNVLDDIVLIVLDGHEPLKELGIDQNKIYVIPTCVNIKKFSVKKNIIKQLIYAIWVVHLQHMTSIKP